ncbi:MAG TPA: hypothetical protein VE244_09310 [Nitrososphaeraceae archaeon]|jgi:hypothetical protein|nr:hypothetical protein [Nitrososphaeraceae archaeon]
MFNKNLEHPDKVSFAGNIVTNKNIEVFKICFRIRIKVEIWDCHRSNLHFCELSYFCLKPASSLLLLVENHLLYVSYILWFRKQVRKIDSNLDFELPILSHDYGSRDLHLGWIKQPDNNSGRRWCFGAFIENGRIIDGSSNGNLKSMINIL